MRGPFRSGLLAVFAVLVAVAGLTPPGEVRAA